mgnify:CR=1 FL=1
MQGGARHFGVQCKKASAKVRGTGVAQQLRGRPLQIGPVHRALSGAVDQFARAARSGPVSPALRQRLARTSGLVAAQRESLSSQPHRGVNVQGVVTTVSGRLGEWIEIGGVSAETSAQQSALLGRSSTAARESRRVLIKVEETR